MRLGRPRWSRRRVLLVPLPSGAWFDYRPGQFLTLELPLPGGTIHRTYTISSSPSRPLSITLTVKAAGASVGTRWMLDNIREGTLVKAIGPGGIFIPDVAPDRKLLLISAGSGVTPMMAITTYRWDIGGKPDICFVQCAKRPSELVFRRHLEHMASRVPSIRLHYVVREDDPHGAWSGYRGQFNQLMLGLMAPDYLEREVYCCGPEPFMQVVRDMLIGFGFDMDHYHQETFTAPVLTPADAPVLDDVVPSAEAASEVVFSVSGKSIPCTEADARARDLAAGRAQHPLGLQLRRLRHLQEAEAVGRGAYGAQRRHLRGRHRRRLHPRLLLASDGTGRDRGLTRLQGAARRAWQSAPAGPARTELGRTRASHPRHEPPGPGSPAGPESCPWHDAVQMAEDLSRRCGARERPFGVSRVSRQGR